jgi:hypothetical protein
MSNSSHNTDDESDSEPHNVSFSNHRQNIAGEISQQKYHETIISHGINIVSMNYIINIAVI